MIMNTRHASAAVLEKTTSEESGESEP